MFKSIALFGVISLSTLFSNSASAETISCLSEGYELKIEKSDQREVVTFFRLKLNLFGKAIGRSPRQIEITEKLIGNDVIALSFQQLGGEKSDRHFYFRFLANRLDKKFIAHIHDGSDAIGYEMPCTVHK